MTSEDRNPLVRYFEAVQGPLQAKINAGEVITHPVGKGDELESIWLEFLKAHLPGRYFPIPKAFVLDHLGGLSDEIDIVIADRNYSPLIVKSETRTYVPAEAIYAAIEVKQDIDAGNVDYARKKIQSVRKLVRTNAQIVDARGLIEPPRTPEKILGILLAARSSWSPAFSPACQHHLLSETGDLIIDLGSALVDGSWERVQNGSSDSLLISSADISLGSFLFSLLARLQRFGSVPAMEYATWNAALKSVLLNPK